MGTISLLQLQRHRRDRVSVHLDGEYAFSVALDLAASLRKGQELSDDEISSLRAEDDYRRGLDRALSFLAHRPRSRQEVTRNLTAHDVPADVAARVIGRLTELALVDDAAFARWWVENRTTHQPRGRRALRHELAERGVSGDVIEAAVADLGERDLARALASARAARFAALPRPDFDRRLGGVLLRRGFELAVVREALDAVWRALREQDP